MTSRPKGAAPKAGRTGTGRLAGGGDGGAPASVDSSSLVRRVASAIREEAFARQPGELLGGEDELVQRFGVSRPTFRQAAKLVEQEQLVTIKRGVGGGYFVCRPDIAAVTHMTAVYLQSRSASLMHIVQAFRPVFVSTSRLAAQNLSSSSRERFESFLLEERATLGQRISTLDYVRSDKRFTLLFAESSGNPLIQLFMGIVLELTAMVGESVWKGHFERIMEMRPLRVRMVEAILSRDVELAEIAARRLTERFVIWTLESSDGATTISAIADQPTASAA